MFVLLHVVSPSNRKESAHLQAMPGVSVLQRSMTNVNEGFPSEEKKKRKGIAFVSLLHGVTLTAPSIKELRTEKGAYIYIYIVDYFNGYTIIREIKL